MRIRPGTHLLGLLGILSLWCLVGFVWPASLWLLPAVLAAAIPILVFEYVALRRGLAEIQLARRAPAVVGRGRPFEVVLALTNRGAQAWSAEVRDEVPGVATPRLRSQWTHLPAGSAATEVSQTFSIPVRGRYVFGPAWLRLRGRCRLLEAQQRVPEVDAVQILPESLVSPEELSKDAADELRLLDQLRKSRHRGIGTEFESLEEFRAGDELRRIDWRTTARCGRPIVRRYQIERHRDLMVVLDCGRLMGADGGRGTKLDCAVDAALRLFRVALRSGDRCGVGIFDDQVLGFLRPMGGTKAFTTLLTALYDVQSQWHETDFGPMFARLQSRQTKRTLVVVLSDVIDADTTGRYRASLATLAQRHVVLFVALRTPLLEQLVRAPLKTVEDGFQKAVVFRTLREREKAIHSLRRGGVNVLDVEPNQLTARLINQFIELRQSNLL